MNVVSTVAILVFKPQRRQDLSSLLPGISADPLLIRNSDALREVLAQRRVDLLILDQEQPGFLTGLEIFERLRRELACPPTILLAEPTTELQNRGAALQLEAILPPESSSEQIVEEARRMLGHPPARTMIVPSTARALVHEHLGVLNFPPGLQEMFAALELQVLSIEDLTRKIALNPEMADKLIKYARGNSSASSARVQTVADALRVVGVKDGIMFAVYSGIVEFLFRAAELLPEDQQAWYRHRAVLTGNVATSLARHIEGASQGIMRIVGSCQDVGMLLMARAHGHRYLRVLRSSQNDPWRPLAVSEREEFQATHAEVSAAALHAAGWPHQMVQTVLHHHAVELADPVPEPLQKLVSGHILAECLADFAGCRSAEGRKIRAEQLGALLGSFDGKLESFQMLLKQALGRAADIAPLLQLTPEQRASLQSMLQRPPDH